MRRYCRSRPLSTTYVPVVLLSIVLIATPLFVCPSTAFLVATGGGNRGAVLATQRHSSAARKASGLDQDSTPLVDALEGAAKNVRAPFFYPGHKMGSGAPSRFVDVILGGKLDALQHDLPELPELDNLFAPEGPIRDAELLAADAFGAAKTWLLANGSTCGVLASIIACVQQHNSRPSVPENGISNNDSVDGASDVGVATVARVKKQSISSSSSSSSSSVVILPRDAHKSAVHALVLSGAMPCFLPPHRHPDSGVSLGICTAALEVALREHGNQVAAVFLVSPTYEGACADIASATKACHAAGVPLIVDEAHGAHLAFLGAEDESRGDSPRAALQCGADLVVQSAHKTLGSLTQSAFLHLGKGILTAEEGPFSMEGAVSNALATVQSSSPSYLLLASLDAARWSLAGAEKNGKRRLEDAVKIARRVREDMSGVTGIHVLELGKKEGWVEGFVGTDPLRLTVSFGAMLGGYEADELLIEEFGVYAELPAPEYITFVFGPGSTPEDGQMLTDALRHVAREAASRQASAATLGGEAEAPVTHPFEMALPAKQMHTPREAFFSPSKTVSANDAIGLASAETVCPYPPGIPSLLPGEVITQEALDLLTAVKDGGGVVSGCADPTLATMRVVDLPLR